MKRKLLFKLVLFISLIFGLSLGSCVTHPPASFYLPDLVGVWTGTYVANQGETGLTLTVWEENGNYRAIFHFYHLPGITQTWIMPEGMEGSYYMIVTSNRATRRYNLIGTEWIHRPGPNWFFVDLEGLVHGDVFSGTVLRGTGGTISGDFRFRVVRQR